MSRGPSSLSALAWIFLFFDFLLMFTLPKVWILEAAQPHSEKDDSSKVLRNPGPEHKTHPDPDVFWKPAWWMDTVIRHLIGR